MLAQKMNISPEQALDIFYSSKTAQQLSNPDTGLQLMSDDYVLEDLLNELNNAKPNNTDNQQQRLRDSESDKSEHILLAVHSTYWPIDSWSY